MTDWRPASGPDAAARRAAILHRVRDYFRQAGVLEVDTPALSPFTVSDPRIESFAITASRASPDPLYLQTSPEYFMKRLLAAGYPDIYSICRVFRDGEVGRRHQPEFTMVEWYRRGMGLQEIIDDTVRVIAAALDDRAPQAAPVCIDYRDAMTAACGIDIGAASSADLAAAAGADERLRAAVGDARDDWLDLLLAAVVVPAFARDRLTVLRHYPATQAALARICPDDPGVADRFEVFFGDVELANGYVELADAGEQGARMHRDNAEREARGLPARPADECLLAALAAGLPPCSGVAMGLERLHMIHDNTRDISEVLTFGFTGDA
jgi:lysyl-tRNA synthetase class 2